MGHLSIESHQFSMSGFELILRAYILISDPDIGKTEGVVCDQKAAADV